MTKKPTLDEILSEFKEQIKGRPLYEKLNKVSKSNEELDDKFRFIFTTGTRYDQKYSSEIYEEFMKELLTSSRKVQETFIEWQTSYTGFRINEQQISSVARIINEIGNHRLYDFIMLRETSKLVKRGSDDRLTKQILELILEQTNIIDQHETTISEIHNMQRRIEEKTTYIAINAAFDDDSDSNPTQSDTESVKRFFEYLKIYRDKTKTRRKHKNTQSYLSEYDNFLSICVELIKNYKNKSLSGDEQERERIVLYRDFENFTRLAVTTTNSNRGSFFRSNVLISPNMMNYQYFHSRNQTSETTMKIKESFIEHLANDMELSMNTLGLINEDFIEVDIKFRTGDKLTEEERTIHRFYLTKMLEQKKLIEESSKRIKNELVTLEIIRNMLNVRGTKADELPRTYDISTIMEEMYIGMRNAQEYVNMRGSNSIKTEYKLLEKHIKNTLLSIAKEADKIARQRHKDKRSQLIDIGMLRYKRVNIIDLGCGDGTKAIAIANRINKEFNIETVINFVDKSQDMLDTASINAYNANIEFETNNTNLKDFFQRLENTSVEKKIRTNIYNSLGLKVLGQDYQETECLNLYLFLGQTIGNLESSTINRMKLLSQENDIVIIEADLKKEKDRYTRLETLLTGYLTKVMPIDAITDKEGQITFQVTEDEQGITISYTLTKDVVLPHRTYDMNKYITTSTLLRKGSEIVVVKSKKFTEEEFTKENEEDMRDMLLKSYINSTAEISDEYNEHFNNRKRAEEQAKKLMKENMHLNTIISDHIIPKLNTRTDDTIIVTYVGSEIGKLMKQSQNSGR